jgi:hypothetical protein
MSKSLGYVKRLFDESTGKMSLTVLRDLGRMVMVAGRNKLVNMVGRRTNSLGGMYNDSSTDRTGCWNRELLPSQRYTYGAH